MRPSQLHWARAVACCLIGAAACRGGLPVLEPLDASRRTRAIEQCRQVFPHGQWRATYVIEAHMPLGNEGSFIGAVASEPGPAHFRSVLMTQEGFVLFDAEYRAGRVEVLRVVPPLDPDRFGRAMTGDVRLTSFLPGGRLVQVGKSRVGPETCRWQEGETTVEVELLGPGRARVLRYDDGALAREALLEDIDPRGFARHSSVETHGMVGYSLSLRLLEVEEHALPPAKVPSSARP